MALSATARQKSFPKAAGMRKPKPGPKPKAEKAYVYTWKGTDRKGNRVSGETRAPNTAMVRAELRRQGVNPSKIRKKPAPSTIAASSSSFGSWLK